MVVNNNPLLYDVKITMKKTELNHTGVSLSTLFLKNVKESAFSGKTGTFYAIMADGSMYMAPKEEIHQVWIKPANSQKNEVTCETCKNNLLGPDYEPRMSCDDNYNGWEGKEN